ncbi:4'-phosphopantetheinyl transferase family protein [Aneurinibacillus uraniidurans]|uniref:4'-phosphopantetheinyl transferase family protein n=1 Tax=Aneurinibacillus uraniidurans TaxID=2966586 RepID=UPI00234B7F77|nr:4'-phosphopantetheinyl transferase superfamily protein [Aneurinibacillus sp. B1]WCN39730.1 4'-phosphopantetheinyl transferase superfamily protein [Aneurinibacillus sp. B1]
MIAVRNTGYISADKLSCYLAKLPAQEQQRILQYKRIEDRQRALLGMLTVNYMFQQYELDIDVMKWYRRDQRGRPYIEASSSWQGDFTISHAGKWIICAMTDKGRVGVDIEEIQPLDFATVFACLSREEFTLLLQQTEANRWVFFYEKWTQKEAIGKAIGTGLITPACFFTIEEVKNNWAIRHYYIDETHLACLCVNTNDLPEHVEYRDDVEIVRHWVEV